MTSKHVKPAGRTTRSPNIIEPEEVNVGQMIRRLRLRQGLSIRDLAAQGGVSVNTLSLIENGRTSPTVATLQRLAAALVIPMAAFFEMTSSNSSVVHVKASQRKRATLSYGVMEDLGTGFIHSAVEPFVVTLQPNTGSGNQSIVHPGYEFAFCIRGSLVYRVGEQTYVLKPGDSILFESRLPHQWHNQEGKPSEFLLVLYPAEAGESGGDGHFVRKPRGRSHHSTPV